MKQTARSAVPTGAPPAMKRSTWRFHSPTRKMRQEEELAGCEWNERRHMWSATILHRYCPGLLLTVFDSLRRRFPHLTHRHKYPSYIKIIGKRGRSIASNSPKRSWLCLKSKFQRLTSPRATFRKVSFPEIIFVFFIRRRVQRMSWAKLHASAASCGPMTKGKQNSKWKEPLLRMPFRINI